MAYNDNPAVVERWRDELDRLDGREVIFHTNDARTLAYRLREAIHAARVNDIQPYASLTYSFSVPAPGKLVAVPKQDVVVHHTSADIGGKHLEGVTEFDVISELLRERSVKRAIFPDFQGNIDRVRTWADKKGYTITDEAPLTLEAPHE